VLALLEQDFVVVVFVVVGCLFDEEMGDSFDPIDLLIVHQYDLHLWVLLRLNAHRIEREVRMKNGHFLKFYEPPIDPCIVDTSVGLLT
jgi:hypothetical protein